MSLFCLDYDCGRTTKTSLALRDIPCFVLSNDTVLSLQIKARDEMRITNQQLDTIR